MTLDEPPADPYSDEGWETCPGCKGTSVEMASRHFEVRATFTDEVEAREALEELEKRDSLMATGIRPVEPRKASPVAATCVMQAARPRSECAKKAPGATLARRDGLMLYWSRSGVDPTGGVMQDADRAALARAGSDAIRNIAIASWSANADLLLALMSTAWPTERAQGQ